MNPIVRRWAASRALPLALIVAAPMSTVGSEPATADTAAEQLAIAKQVRRDANKKEPDEKRRILLAAADAYQVILDRFADDHVPCAEAAFRIGEIHRSLGDAARASQAFERVLDHGAHHERFAARALTELGHLARRAGRGDDAIGFYERAIDEYPQRTGEGATALVWIGKVEDRRGRREEARAAWLSVGDRFPSEPVRAIRAADLAALSALDDGDVKRAGKIVEETRRRYGGDNGDQEWWTPEVESALGRMKSATRLADLVADDG